MVVWGDGDGVSRRFRRSPADVHPDIPAERKQGKRELFVFGNCFCFSIFIFFLFLGKETVERRSWRRNFIAEGNFGFKYRLDRTRSFSFSSSTRAKRRP